MSNKIEIVVGENALSVVYEGEEYFIVTVDEDAQTLSAVAPLFEKMQWVNEIEELPTPDLRVNVREHKKKIARLRPTKLREKKEEAKTARLKPVQRAPIASTGGAVSPLEEWEREQTLRLIVESYTEHPDQTSEYRADESRRIAKEVFGHEEEIMRVAGVRAALTRGAYDRSLQEMVEDMRKERYDGRVAREVR